MMSKASEFSEVGSFLKSKAFNKDIANKYPNNLYYYFINSEFMKLKKATRTQLIKDYDIIISNENHRELIFNGVYCILTTKEYFLVKYLLEMGSFHNKNFTQTDLKYTTMFRKRVRKKYKLTNKSEKFKGNTFVIVKKEKTELNKIFRKIRKNPKSSIIKLKKVQKQKSFTSDNKSEISNYRNKIKSKVEKNMLKQNTLLSVYDKCRKEARALSRSFR